MTNLKVSAVQLASRHPLVRFNKASLVCASFFVANLVTEPMKAYVSEPLPWALNSTLLNENKTFDEFVYSTYLLFATKYNNHTLRPDTAVSQDKSANTILLRYNLTLPSNQVDRCNAYQIQFPGAMLFGEGTVRFVCDFLAQNASTQLVMPRYMCQHHVLVGSFVTAESCLWIDPFPTAG
ncbi:hypothetical protein As57867_004569, partial [Aphanomyces stellatus]